jgi:hypothetical protein
MPTRYQAAATDTVQTKCILKNKIVFMDQGKQTRKTGQILQGQ